MKGVNALGYINVRLDNYIAAKVKLSLYPGRDERDIGKTGDQNGMGGSSCG